MPRSSRRHSPAPSLLAVVTMLIAWCIPATGQDAKTPGQAPDYAFGFTNVFTAYSSGKININTADETVLQLIPGMDTTSAENIMKFRAGPDGVDGTEDDTPFQNPSQIAGAGVNPQAAAQIANFCTTRSTTFEVHVTAQIGQQTREFTGVIFVYGPNTQIVRFYWDD